VRGQSRKGLPAHFLLFLYSNGAVAGLRAPVWAPIGADRKNPKICGETRSYLNKG